MPRWLPVVPLALAIAPPALVADRLVRHAVNVPYKDHWAHVPFIRNAVRGVFTGADLWAQVNEHRIPLARLVQGGLAWATRWDVRWEAYVDFAIAVAAFALIVDLVRRTIAPPLVASGVVLVSSLLHFSPGQGENWTWGAMMPAYLAALSAAGLAWSTARLDGTWERTTAVVGWAVAGALSFGSGLGLLAIAPLVLLAAPTPAPPRIRAQQATFALVVAVGLAVVYAIGWQPRPPEARATGGHALGVYAGYVLAYLGRPSGTASYAVAQSWGVAGLAVLAAAGGFVWHAAPGRRHAVVAWGALALYPIVAGVLTAYGRVDVALGTAGLTRYLPTSTFFPVSVAAVAALAIAELAVRARRAGVVAAGTIALTGVLAAGSWVDFGVAGVARMRELQRRLEAGATCLPTCPDAPDACLVQMCWDARLARYMCPAMKADRFGPYAE